MLTEKPLRNVFLHTIFIWTFIPLSLNSDTDFADDVIPGHRKELGKHRSAEGHIDLIYSLPSPEEFWENYAKIRRPMLLRGFAQNFPASSLWTDEHVREKFGHLKVKIESKAEKEGYPEGELGVGQDTLENFLRTYQDKNTYVVSQLPDPMSTDVMVFPFLTCGTFGERILEANLWLSSGGTKSLLHRDADNAVNCLLNGTKDWILIDPSFEHLIPIGEEDTMAYGGFSLLDPDSVNLQKYPQFRDVPWWYANMSAGDCLFIPYGYWHQVRSYGNKNMAVSVLFSRLQEVDLTECQNTNLDFVALSEMDMIYTYDGYSDQTMGNTDPFELNETLLEWCKRQNLLDAKILLQYFSEDFIEQDGAGIESNRDVLKQISREVVRVLDENDDEIIQCLELSQLSLQTLKTVANIIDFDPANTEVYEYTTYEPSQITTVLYEALQEAHLLNEGQITLPILTNHYQHLGGSIKIAKEIFDALDTAQTGSVSRDQLDNNLAVVQKMFEKKAKIHSSEHWIKETEESLKRETSVNEERLTVQDDPEVSKKDSKIQKNFLREEL